MKSIIEQAIEKVKTGKNYKSNQVEGGPKHLDAPAAGSPLYHRTGHSWKDPSTVHTSKDHPVTWFTSGSKGYGGAKQMRFGHDSMGPSHIHIRKLNSGVNLANEKDLHHSMAHVMGGKPSDYKHHYMPDALDGNIYGGNREHAHAIVDHLKSKGFHGVVHSDDSMWNGADDMPKTHVVGLFEPNKHSTHVKHVKEADENVAEVEKHQKAYEDSLKK